MSKKDTQISMNKGDCALMSGSENNDFALVLCRQVLKTLWLASNKDQQQAQGEAAIASLKGIKPSDEIEGMMAAQMVGLYNAAMEQMRRAMIPEQSLEGTAVALSQANKLTRSYAMLLEALSRYRGKGVSEQKVTVEHVHVHAGGQAIVGNVTREGGGDITKSEEQPHAKQITDTPMPEMPSLHPQGQPVPIPGNA